MNALLQDLHYGFRMLLKSPGFTVAAVLSLALGIGANTAIFSVVNTILLRPLPYQDPARLVLVWGDLPAEGKNRSQVSATDVADWRHQNHVFEEITTYGNWSATFTNGANDNRPERVAGMQVGDGYFQLMRGTPLLGRVFLPEEQQDGKDFVLVLSYGLWQRRFGGDPHVVGQQISLGGRAYTIVGVMPADFQSLPANLIGAQPAQFYRPVAEPPDEDARASRHLRCIARLRAGVTLAEAQSEMDVLAARLRQTHPKSNTGYGVRLTTLPEDTVGSLRPVLFTLFGAVLFVLLIACANVGNLLLARATARQKEIAIRAALGAGRLRLVRQLLTESVLLALMGGGLGLLLALWGTEMIARLGVKVTPLLNGISVDVRVLLFTFGVSLATGMLFGFAPALQLSRPSLTEALKEGGRSSGAGARRNRLRAGLVVAETALALVLLVCAALLIKTVVRLRAVDPGFNAAHLLTMDVSLPSARYAQPATQAAFFKQVTERIAALPGVTAVGATSVLPFGDNFDGRALAIEDQPRPPGQELSVDLYITTPDYLRAMQTTLLAGRALTERDTTDAPLVALINETMARQLWPDQDPIGKRIKFPGSDKHPQPWRTVVGVVRDVKQYALDRADKMQLYLPEAQYPTSAMTLVVRTAPEPTTLTAAVRREVQAVDSELAVYNIATMAQLLADSMALRRFSMFLLGLFAAVALVLAALGSYGVMAYSVTQRTHELGIRIALGAQGADVLRLVVGQGLTLALVGVAFGLVGALLLTRLLASLLYGVTATDPATFTLVALLLTLVALVACYVPARRALQVEPVIALRCE